MLGLVSIPLVLSIYVIYDLAILSVETNVRIALYKPHRSELNVDANLKVDACRRVLEKPKSYRSVLILDNDTPNDKRLSSHTENAIKQTSVVE